MYTSADEVFSTVRVHLVHDDLVHAQMLENSTALRRSVYLALSEEITKRKEEAN